METREKTHGTYYGPLMMLGAALLFSMGGAVIKLIPWSALAINGVRNLIAAATMGCYLLFKRHKLRFNKTVLFGAVCMSGVTTLFFVADTPTNALFSVANKLTTAANAIILQYACPIWIILMMAIFFREKPSRRDVGTMAVVFLGILCFFFDSLAAGNVLGDLAAILSGVFYAGVFLLNSFEDGDSLSSIFFGQLACGVILSPLVTRETAFSPVILLAVFFMGAIQIGVAYIMFSEGTRYTPPVAASLIATVEPVMNPILVAIFWGEMLRPLSLVGAFIVIAAVLVYNIRKG